MTAEATAPALNVRGLRGFGKSLLVNLAGCDAVILDSSDDLITFVGLLAERIGMTTYGDPQLAEFGEGDLHGKTVTQLITTSHFAVHANPSDLTLFLDVFSCKDFDEHAAAELAVGFFRATGYSFDVYERTAPTLETR
jgi:S-adenosylmethionine decarboxylase